MLNILLLAILGAATHHHAKTHLKSAPVLIQLENTDGMDTGELIDSLDAILEEEDEDGLTSY
jgi:hypothetical protein